MILEKDKFLIVNGFVTSVFTYCIYRYGKWWANSFFHNKEVIIMFDKIIDLDVEAIQYIIDSTEDYETALELYKVRSIL